MESGTGLKAARRLKQKEHYEKERYGEEWGKDHGRSSQKSDISKDPYRVSFL